MFRNYKIDNARRVEFEGEHIQIPKSKWGYLRDSVFYGKTIQDGEPTPDNPVDLVNIPPEFNLTVCGRNLFFRKEPFSILNNGCTHTWNPSTQEYRITGVGQGYNTTALMRLSYPHPLEFTSGMFFRIWATGTTPAVIYPRLMNASTANVATMSIPSGTYSNTHFQGYLREVEDNTVVIFSPVVYVLEGKTIDITFKIMISYEDAAYEPYQGSTYPYRLEDLDGNLHELCSLPDGTADSYDRDSGEFVARIKTFTVSSSAGITYAPHVGTLAQVRITDTANKWTENLSYQDNIRCNIGKRIITPIPSSQRAYDVYFNKSTSGTQIRILVPQSELSSLDDAGAQAWINAQIAAKGNIVFQYPLATPQIYKIKQYGKTYNGQVWGSNQKPVQPEDDVANVFTDVNIPMKFKAISYGG